MKTIELTDDFPQILNTELNLDNVTVLGLKFGDSSTKIPSSIIKEGPWGGWYHTDKDLKIRCSEDGEERIVEFIFTSKILSQLGFWKKNKIRNRLGEPSAIEKSNNQVNHFYLKQNLVVQFDAAGKTLEQIYFGENVLKPTTYSIKDFLKLYQDFKAMVPNRSEWNLKSLEYNEPRYYRLMQLNSFMKAFDIGSDLQKDIQQCRFLNNRSQSDLEPLTVDFKAYLSRYPDEEKRWKEKGTKAIQDNSGFEMGFLNLMKFSDHMRNTMEFNSGWLEAGSIFVRYSIRRTQHMLNGIDLTELEEIENIICKLLDPKQRIFTQYELIKNYDFPDVDLAEIDMDNY